MNVRVHTQARARTHVRAGGNRGWLRGWGGWQQERDPPLGSQIRSEALFSELRGSTISVASITLTLTHSSTYGNVGRGLFHYPWDLTQLGGWAGVK